MSGAFDSDEDLWINRSIFENSLDAILLTKPDGTILAANPTAEKMFDMTEEEIKAAGRDGILVQDENLKSALEERAQKGRVKAELNFKRKNGTTFPGEMTSTIFIDTNGNDRTNMTIRDLSDLKSTEKNLVESEKRYHLVADFTYDWEEWIDNKKRLKYISPSCERITGYNAQEFLANPNLLFSIVHTDDQKLYKNHLNIDFSNENAESIVFRIISRDNNIHWIEHICQPVYDDNGQFMGRRASNRDITERKRAEEELHKSEEKYRNIVETANEGIMIADINGIITFANNRMSEMLGYTIEELVGKDGLSFIDPTELNKSLERIKKREIGIKENYELKFRRKDGVELWTLVSGTPIHDQDGIHVGNLAMYTNITKRKQAETKLKETLNNLEELVEERTKELYLANVYNRNLLETSLDPLVTIGPDGKITDVNKATEEVTGYSREELVSTDFADYFTNPKKAEEGYQLVFQEGEVRDYPLKIKHRYGSTTPVLYNASVYKDESGEVIGVFAAARDITERQKAEDAFRVYWESLEEQVKIRTEELAKSNADLKQFAYVASHDLREPLRMITTFLQLLERRYTDQLDEDANEFIGFAVDGAKRLDTMIMDLLEYSRVANVEMHFTEVDIQEVVLQVTHNLKVLIQENSTQITNDPLPIIQSDENQMIILLQNLISNAIKYRSEKTPQIHISAEKEADKYVFSVKDNGIGIDPKHLERIFTIFKRLHTHEEYEGSGIGLSIAQRIVHQHSGEIWAESQPEQGSTFYFTIPTIYGVLK